MLTPSTVTLKKSSPNPGISPSQVSIIASKKFKSTLVWVGRFSKVRVVLFPGPSVTFLRKLPEKTLLPVPFPSKF